MALSRTRPHFLPEASRGRAHPSKIRLHQTRPHNNVHLKIQSNRRPFPLRHLVFPRADGVLWEVRHGEGRDNVSTIQRALKWRGESPSSPPFPNTLFQKPYWPWKRTNESLTPVSRKRRFSSKISLMAAFIYSTSLLTRPLSCLPCAMSNIDLTLFPCIIHHRISGCDSPDPGRAFRNAA